MFGACQCKWVIQIIETCLLLYNYFMYVRPAQDWEVDLCQFLLGVVFSLCKNREERYVVKVEQNWLF